MIGRPLLGLALLGAVGASLAERALRRGRRGTRPAPVRTATVIAAPIDAVWTTLVDIEGQPRWMRDMKSVRMEPGPLRVGSRGVATVRMYGIAVPDPVTVTELQPPTRFGISHDGLFAGRGRFQLEALGGDRTSVTWEEELVAPVLPHLVAAITAPVFRSVFGRDLDRLRALVEGGG